MFQLLVRTFVNRCRRWTKLAWNRKRWTFPMVCRKCCSKDVLPAILASVATSTCNFPSKLHSSLSTVLLNRCFSVLAASANKPTPRPVCSQKASQQLNNCSVLHKLKAFRNGTKKCLCSFQIRCHAFMPFYWWRFCLYLKQVSHMLFWTVAGLQAVWMGFKAWFEAFQLS